MVNYTEPKTIEECLNLQSHFIGIPKISKNNYQEFYRRGKTLQLLGVGFWNEGKMPTLEEVESHIDLTTEAQPLDTKKWNTVILSILKDMTNNLIEFEQNELATTDVTD